MSTFNERKQKWEAGMLKKSLEKGGEERRKGEFETTSGIPVQRVAGPASGEYPDSLGMPGEYPFTRGIQPTMYRARHWTMRQYAGFGDAEESNKRYRYLLEQGTTGLSVAFDLPTQMGRDSDHELARGEVGKVGVAIDSLADMEILFANIPLDKVTTSMTINATASILLGLYLAVAEKQGVPWDKVGGTIQNDVLKEYIARGTYIYPPSQSMRIITDIFAFCTEHVPRWNTISISGYHIREAGSTAVQEVAFTLADAIAYVDAAVRVGLDVDDFAGRLSFFFNVHNNFLEEVAKFRAARRLWAKIMKERFAAKNTRSMMLRFHSQTAGSSLTAQQPINNVVRTAIQALASVLGGTQSLHTNSFDEALGLPTEAAARTALRTQQVIAYESGVADTIDPLAGSYYVEYLTDEIERRAEEYIQTIDKLGGAVAAIENGFPQREIQQAAYKYQQAVESRDDIVVGVNRFEMEEEGPTDILRIDPGLEKRQVDKLTKLKASRDNDAVKRALKRVSETAAGEANLMPAIVDAVRVYATLGEISDAMRAQFGEFTPPVFV
jgi:methylmalonyl-CoA mutase N-terminal domain/subunit